MIKRVYFMLVILILTAMQVSQINADEYVYRTYKNLKYRCETGAKSESIDIIQYSGKKKDLSIPAKIRGHKVMCVFLKKTKQVKKIFIPKYVEYVDLGKVKTLKEVRVSKKNKYLCAENNMILNKNKTELKAILGGYKKITIEKNIKTIGIGSCENPRLEKITVLGNLKTIKNSAFDGCKKLKKIVFKGNCIPHFSEYVFDFTTRMNFHVNNKKLAKKLLNELKGKTDARVYIYVGKKLIYNKKLKTVNNY